MINKLTHEDALSIETLIGPFGACEIPELDFSGEEIVTKAREFYDFRNLMGSDEIILTDEPILTSAAVASALQELGLTDRVSIADLHDAEKWPFLFREVSKSVQGHSVYLGFEILKDVTYVNEVYVSREEYAPLDQIAKRLAELGLGGGEDRLYPIYASPNHFFNPPDLERDGSRSLLQNFARDSYKSVADPQGCGLQLVYADPLESDKANIRMQALAQNVSSTLLLKVKRSKLSR